MKHFERTRHQPAILKEIYSQGSGRFISLLSHPLCPKTRHIYIFICVTNGWEVRKIWDICRNVDVSKPLLMIYTSSSAWYNSQSQPLLSTKREMNIKMLLDQPLRQYDSNIKYKNLLYTRVRLKGNYSNKNPIYWHLPHSTINQFNILVGFLQ